MFKFNLTKDYRSNRLSHFAEGYVEVGRNHIGVQEYYKSGGSSWSRLHGIQRLQNHILVLDINDKPIRIFHTDDGFIRWVKRVYVRKS